MQRTTFGFLLLLLSCSTGFAQTKPIRFWNLTTETVTNLYLSPAGKDTWGPDQCKNDPDGEVDHRERLPINGVEPGRYDAKVGYRNGRTCMVKNIELKAGGVFSI